MPMQPLPFRPRLSPEEQLRASQEWLQHMSLRRTVREFAPDPIEDSVIENCLLAAGSAPSGANLQPWHFACVTSKAIQREIRIAAEIEEREFYERRAPQAWLDALAPLGTDANKPFLEIAPLLIAIFVQSYGESPDGTKLKHYYAVESVGIACGMLITAFHQCGLSTLTHTPSPMSFLNRILKRPINERPFLLLVVGLPASHATVPVLSKKSLNQIASFFRDEP